VARPELEVWVATGDGDSLSIGGNHLIHTLRRNVGVKIVMFNNRIYGLTKGQYSPTSETGKRTKSSPYGSVDNPFDPLSLALGAGATFVARSVDIYQKHLKEVLRAAAAHKGSAYIEVYQNCNIFNDGAFRFMTDKETRNDRTLYLEHGKPMLFGKDNERGIRMNGTRLEVVQLGDGLTADDCLVWDETQPDPTLAFMVAQMRPPKFPTPLGVLRSVDTLPYEQAVAQQIETAIDTQGQGTLEELVYSGELWTVGEDGQIVQGKG